MAPRLARYCTLFSCVAAAQTSGAPTLEKLVAAEYPPLARQARIEGRVRLDCEIDAGGSVTACGGTGHALLVESATANAKTWRFRLSGDREPGRNRVVLTYDYVLSGEPVRRTPRLQFTFEAPGQVRIVSEPPCPDHLPCTPEEMKQPRKRKSSRRTRSIP